MVRQAGPRSPGDEAEAAHAWWVGLGKPEAYDLGLTGTVADDDAVRHTTSYKHPAHSVPAA